MKKKVFLRDNINVIIIVFYKEYRDNYVVEEMQNSDDSSQHTDKKSKVIENLEKNLGKVDRWVVKVLIAGLLLSIMVTITGGLFFLIVQFIPELGWTFLLSLPIGLIISIIGGALFILFGLLILFNLIWRKGYLLLLRWFYSLAD